MSTRIDLPPELEAFARDCVTSGRYSDTNDVIRRLQDAETRRNSFNTMLAETDRDGTFDLDTMLAGADGIIESRSGVR